MYDLTWTAKQKTPEEISLFKVPELLIIPTY